jgi:hypothetical protein
MSFLTLRAYFNLIRMDFFLARGNFAALYRKVRDCPPGRNVPAEGIVAQICSAINAACIWYPKEVQCLQRSAATACLLKEHGVSAQMVIGAQRMPIKAHAWVEVGGIVVNDTPYTAEMYAVLDRC